MFLKRKKEVIFVEVGGYIPKLRGFQEILSRRPTFYDILNFLAEKGKVSAGVFLNVFPSNLTLSEIWEIKRVIKILRDRGVKVVCKLQSGGIEEVFMSEICDKVLTREDSIFFLNGFSASLSSFGKFFSKIGVKIEAIKSGKMKSIPDLLTKTEVPESIKKDMKRFFGEIKQALISESKKFDGNIFFSGVKRAKELITSDVIDVITSDSEEEIIRKEFGGDVEVVYFQRRRFSVPFISGTKSKLAVVNMNGVIADNPYPNFINPSYFSSLLMRLAESKSVEAVLVRIDSRGGDAEGSHILNEKIDYIAKKKNVFVSFSSVGASGGYLASVSAKKIFATPFSAIGSIGVFLIKPFISELLQKIGIKTEVLEEGEMSSIFSPYKKLGEKEKKVLEKIVKDEHESFIKKVSEGRGIPVEKLREIADGSVFSGMKARELGLVDDIKSFSEVLDEMKEGKDLAVEEYPKVSIYDVFFRSIRPSFLYDSDIIFVKDIAFEILRGGRRFFYIAFFPVQLERL